MRKIVILGAGFGGLHALQHLERALEGRRRLQITLVTEQSHFLFTPLLPNVATGELTLQSITLPMAEQIGPATELVIDRVEHIDLDARVLHAQRHTLPFDYLLVAPGAQTDWRGRDSWRPHAITCKSSRDAVHIRETLQRAFERAAELDPQARRRALTFVFAGGGPTGVELAAELHASLRHELFDRIAPELVEATRFVLVEPAARLLQNLPPELDRIAQRHLREAGIEVRLGRRVVERDATELALDDGTILPCEHFFWCAGVRPSELLEGSGLELDSGGRARVRASLQAVGHEGVFVIGDAAAPPGGAAQTAQVAKQQGPHAARNLVATLSGRTLKPWRATHLGDMLTLGRGRAAISVMGMTLEGRSAYAMYRIAYASLMPGPMRKLRIIAEWLEHDLQTARAERPLLER